VAGLEKANTPNQTQKKTGETKYQMAIDISGDGGVLKEIIIEGLGSDLPQKDDEVFVHYIGMFIFDSHSHHSLFLSASLQ
jgi:FKBP-type peptidyl-prolyl cis-trans isomerase